MEGWKAGWRGLMYWHILWYELDLPEDNWSDVGAIKGALQRWAIQHSLDLNESLRIGAPLIK